jgi:hypothetical protein
MTAKLDGTNGLIQQYDYQAPTTGFSYTFAAGTQVLVMNPAGTLATGTITMPASPADGMTITFSSTQTITALTVQGNTGQSITGQPTTFGAGSAATFVYRLSNTTWYPNTANANGTLTNATLVTPNINSAQVPTISGTAPLYMCRAWVNFNGTGTVAIRASANVSSITDNGTGLYTVNFTTAMPDANYSAVGTCNFEVDVGLPFNTRTLATSSAGVETYRPYPYNTAVDVSTVSLAIFR